MHDLGDFVAEPVWLEPYPERSPGGGSDAEPEACYQRRESVELAFSDELAGRAAGH
ncbi:MAG TPA: hypothetical protein VFZ79_12850 [Acidimicrobiales bacterium]